MALAQAKGKVVAVATAPTAGTAAEEVSLQNYTQVMAGDPLSTMVLLEDRQRILRLGFAWYRELRLRPVSLGPVTSGKHPEHLQKMHKEGEEIMLHRVVVLKYLASCPPGSMGMGDYFDILHRAVECNRKLRSMLRTIAKYIRRHGLGDSLKHCPRQ